MAGTSHVRNDLPCQDASWATKLFVDSVEFYLAACADGAGSATFAREGARLATESAVKRAVSDLETTRGIPDDPAAWLRTLALHVRGEVLDEAARQERTGREYACTFLMAVVGPACACFVQIGDGAIVVARPGGLEPVFWPESGEYINTTHFLTDENAAHHVQTCHLDERIDQLAMFTDGLQQLALNFASRTAHGPFFEPMLDALAQHDSDTLNVELLSFLESNAVNARTDDDKTLLLAVRDAEG